MSQSVYYINLKTVHVSVLVDLFGRIPVKSQIYYTFAEYVVQNGSIFFKKFLIDIVKYEICNL
jgi:hypothetical protein